MSDDVARQAQAWVALLLSGEATWADGQALSAWRSADAGHEAAFAQAARLHGLARRAAGELKAERREKTPQGPRPGVTRRLAIGGSIAASAAGAALVIGYEQGPGRADGYQTAKGETRRIDLAEGAAVELNTLTRIALRKDLGSAAFELLSGEALVTIDRVGRGPAMILARGGETTAGRAKLSLRCLDGEVRVSCLEGEASVRSSGRVVSLPGRFSLVYDDDRLTPPRPIDLEAEGAWRRGMLVFRNERLGDVIDEINRYRAGQIVIASASLRERRVSGTFHTDRIDQVVDQLRLAYGVSAARLPGGVVVVA